MLELLTFLMMSMAAYRCARKGLLWSCTALVNVFLAGLFAFNFWEPITDFIEPKITGSRIAGYEDFFCLLFLYGFALRLLFYATSWLAKNSLTFPPLAQYAGGAFFGLLAGYLLSGFMVCMMQTLPWQENFLFFDPRYESGKPLRRLLPADRVWLAMMHRAGDGVFSRTEETFDEDGTFTLRYARYRRFNNERPPLLYHGELDRETPTAKKE